MSSGELETTSTPRPSSACAAILAAVTPPGAREMPSIPPVAGTSLNVTGLSGGAYFRRAALGDPGPRSKRAAPSEQSRLKADHVVAINRWGNLANQGIRALNEIALRAAPATSRDRLADEVIATRELLRGAVAALTQTLAMVRGEPD
jgi:hypothetical protein